MRLQHLSSNDYLGLFEREDMRGELYAQFQGELPHLSSASSRLLTGNNRASEELETLLAELYNKESALIFNSGYHVNSVLLAALSHSGSFIISDKFVHASIIDGIKLSSSPFARYSHNDMEHLERILQKEYDSYSQIFIATEGVFSMGGDKGKIAELVELKKRYPNIVLYVDEAHSFGVCGEYGLGVCEELGLLNEVDIIIGTFGKAISSVGAYAVMPKIVREYLVNKMRPLIFSTSLPPLNIEWSRFVVSRIAGLKAERERLHQLSQLLRERLSVTDSESQIIGYTVGEASRAVALSKELIESRFSHAVSSYDCNATAQREICERLFNLVYKGGIAQSPRVLEFGCGTGNLSQLLATLNPSELLLNDLCSSYKEVLIDKVTTNYNFVRGDAKALITELNSQNQKFDIIASASALQWIDRPLQFLSECFELLSPNGILLVSSFAPDNISEVTAITKSGLNYPSLESYRFALDQKCEILHLSSENITLHFDSPFELLSHLKHSGVTASKSNRGWTRGDLRKFESKYNNRFREQDLRCPLTYRPLYLICKK